MDQVQRKNRQIKIFIFKQSFNNKSSNFLFLVIHYFFNIIHRQSVIFFINSAIYNCSTSFNYENNRTNAVSDHCFVKKMSRENADIMTLFYKMIFILAGRCNITHLPDSSHNTRVAPRTTILIIFLW